MHTTSIRIVLLSGAAAASLAFAGAAHAQTQTGTDAGSPPPSTANVQPADPTADPGADSAPDIIVTATKRNERLQDVPASVAVVTASNLAQEGAVRFQDYGSRIPGLSLTSGRTGNTQITLRGITTGSAQPGSTTAFYIDEAPFGSVNAYTGGNGITPDLDPSDLAQIEVLKGPQGTLYGAGAVGGLLKFTTVSPNLRDYQFAGSAGINTVEHGDIGYSARGSINIPLVADQLAFHASGFYRRDGGYIDNVNGRIGSHDINRSDVRGGRGVLSMRFGPHVRLDLSGLLQDTTSRGTNLVDVDAATLRPLRGDLTQNRQVEEDGRQRIRLYNATIRADLGGINLVSSTTYQRIFYQEISDAQYTFAPTFAALSGNPGLDIALNTIKHTDRWSEEARASTNDIGGFLDLQAGFYWTHEGDQNRILEGRAFNGATGANIPNLTIPALAALGLPTTSPFGVIQARIDSTYEEYSFFGNARIHVGDKFDVLGGVRWSHDDQTFIQDYRGLLIPLIAGGQPRVLAVGSEHHSVATWLVSPRYRFSRDAMIYARVASGYRPGGPNPAPPGGAIPSTFQPDRLVQYEVGFKGSAMNRAVSIEAAAFYTDWNNIQIQTSAGGFNFLVNGGSVRSQGGELTLRVQPVTGLTFGLNGAYTDAKLTSAAPAAGGLRGDRLPYVPRFSGSLTGDYTVAMGGGRNLNLGASLNYVGDRTSDYANRFPKRLGDYATVDLRAGVDFGTFTLSAYARNLTDNRAITVVGNEGLAPSNTSGAVYGAAVIQPRTIGAEVAVHF